MATRGEIKRNIRLKNGETGGSLAETLLLDEIVHQAVQKVALMDTFYTYFDEDLEGDVGDPVTRLCLPSGSEGGIYKLKAVRAWDGSAYKLFTEGRGLVNPSWMDSRFPVWREDPEEGVPEYVVNARPDVILYPLPNYTKPAGVRFYGFAFPGKLWNPLSTEIDDDDEFPLPLWCQEAVEAWGVYLRALQTAGKNDIARAREYKALFDDDLAPEAQMRAAQEWQRGWQD